MTVVRKTNSPPDGTRRQSVLIIRISPLQAEVPTAARDTRSAHSSAVEPVRSSTSSRTPSNRLSVDQSQSPETSDESDPTRARGSNYYMQS